MQKARQNNRNNFMIHVIRIIHCLFTLFFIFCIISIYYSEVTGRRGIFLYFSIGALVSEGIAIFFKKECPLRFLHRKYGDNKGFFDLFMPKKILPYIIPFFIVVTFTGIVLLFL